ncbi:MAG: prephenate dehydratase [Syntrophales bacterium]|nr:prephenate dehydratase [Syntrophales bacterium]
MEITLERIRLAIREVDEKIVSLLNERARLAVQIGKLKEIKNVDIFDPVQEMKVLNHISNVNHGPMSDEDLRAIYREILSTSRKLQKPLTVACLGPAGSFSHIALRKVFGSSVEVCFTPNIGNVFDEVEKEKVDYGLVPLENSLEGSVTQTLDRLVVTTLSIRAEICLRISHYLLSNEKSLRDIKRVYSHPQALGQCREWLSRNLPHTTWVGVDSTADAARKAGVDEGSAAIGSYLASEIYGIPILERGIEDYPHNITRFVVLGRGETAPTGIDKTSIIIATPHVPGALYRALEPFAQEAINLLRIESHPSREHIWEYRFFIDLEGHVDDQKVRRCLDEVKRRTTLLKVLGSYMQDKGVV